jgi:hypothetical protein
VLNGSSGYVGSSFISPSERDVVEDLFHQETHILLFDDAYFPRQICNVGGAIMDVSEPHEKRFEILEDCQEDEEDYTPSIDSIDS